VTTSLIDTGNVALKEGRWQAAAEAFRRALGGDQHAEALLGLGQTLWWLGDMTAAMAHLERAYAAFRHRPDPVYAAACALRLAFHHHGHLANPTVANGWIARASRFIEEHQLDVLQGELLLVKAYVTDDAAAGEAWAREALARGKAMGDVDLELCSLSQLGASLVEQGRVDEGLALLGEAMAACLGGETANLETVVFANCRTMVSCARCADFARAVQWVRAAERVAVERSVPFLHAECRTVYTNVLFATGAWDAVEETARTALAMSKGQAPAYEASALATLADLRLAQGRVEEAERLLAGFESHPAAVPVLARLQLQSGKPALAAATVRRRLDLIGPGQLEGARLLELLGEAEIAQGSCDQAAERGRDLAALAAAGSCRVASARGQRLEARAVAPHNPAAARPLFDRALGTFSELGMPYEAARTQAAIAWSFRQTDPELAAAEARNALATFERLGAAGDADMTAALLRELGVRAARSGTKGLAGLTRREREVLQLLGEGLSNPEIAERLFVSRKTVEHHVAHILDKLGLKSRAQAAAEAVRRLNAESARK
jgi:DNA-binding CsgD family transcriptional regulator